jgi:hypothetical protein
VCRQYRSTPDGCHSLASPDILEETPASRARAGRFFTIKSSTPIFRSRSQIASIPSILRRPRNTVTTSISRGAICPGTAATLPPDSSPSGIPEQTRDFGGIRESGRRGHREGLVWAGLSFTVTRRRGSHHGMTSADTHAIRTCAWVNITESRTDV